jgi:tetratricopeptide (TPR) repeat protein
LRDALPRSSVDALVGSFRDARQQHTGAALSFGIAAATLGRYSLALTEFEFVSLSSDALSEENQPALFQQMARAKARFGLIAEADLLASKAVELAEKSSSRLYLGGALETQSLLASEAHREGEAIELGKRAFASFKAAGQTLDCARMLNNLAQSYFNLGRISAARRAIQSAERLASDLNADAVRSRSRILLGEIEVLNGDQPKAAALWHDALEIARRSHDSVVHFKAEFQLFKLAVMQRNNTVTNALGRRLERMSPWIAPTEPEVAEFRALYLIHRKPKQRSVAARQLDRIERRNPT